MDFMQLGRSLALSAGLFMSAGMAQVHAQTPPAGLPGNYPAKPVRIYVGVAAGGGTDISARLVAKYMSERWGQQFLVENKVSNAGSVIALDFLSKQKPDAYQLQVPAFSTYLGAVLVAKLPYDVLTTFDPIAQFTRGPMVLAVTNSLPATSVKEFIDYVKKNPDKLNYASTGPGSSAHITAEYFLHAAGGLRMQHIPYKGTGAGMADFLAGRVQMFFGSPVGMMPQAKKGVVRVLAVTSATRLKSQPDLPALAESLPGFEYSLWYGLIGPAGMPRPIISALNRLVNEVLAIPEVNSRLSADGSEIVTDTPEAFNEVMTRSLRSIEKLVKDTGLDLSEAR